MSTVVRLYSNINGEIEKFLKHFYNSDFKIEADLEWEQKFENPIEIEADLEWEQKFENPIEIVDIIGAFIENDDAYKISMWISMDEGCFIHVSDDNADEIIRYLYERFPY